MNAGSVCKRGVLTVTPTDDLGTEELINITGATRDERRVECAVRHWGRPRG